MSSTWLGRARRYALPLAAGALSRASEEPRKALLLVRRGDAQHFVALDAA